MQYENDKELTIMEHMQNRKVRIKFSVTTSKVNHILNLIDTNSIDF